jgi:hypothetical protein
MSVVDQCDVWAKAVKMEVAAVANFNAGKGELLELARNQVSFRYLFFFAKEPTTFHIA